jgi:hypothetical protein
VNDFEAVEPLKHLSTVAYCGCGRESTLFIISQFPRALNRFRPEFPGYYLVVEIQKSAWG